MKVFVTGKILDIQIDLGNLGIESWDKFRLMGIIDISMLSYAPCAPRNARVRCRS